MRKAIRAGNCAVACAVTIAAAMGVVQARPQPPAVEAHAPRAIAQDPELPAGDGRDLVLRLCSDCHGLKTAVAQRRSLSGWEDTMATMVGRGVGGTDEELKAATMYLARAFGKVDVNAADARELEAVLEIPTELANAIIKSRPYEKFDDLARVPGIDVKALATRQDRVVFAPGLHAADERRSYRA